MLDTLELELPLVEVRKGCRLEVDRKFSWQTSKGEDGQELEKYQESSLGILYEDSAGIQYTGKKAYYNDPRGWNYDVKFQRQGKVIRPVHRVHFSVPRVVHGDNFVPAGEQTLREACEKVETEMHEYGLTTKLDQALISRVDCTKNLFLTKPYSDYMQVGEALGGTLMKERVQYPNGIRISNSQRELALYDKIEEMRNRRLKVEHLEPLTVMRCEARARPRQAVRSYLGTVSLSDLKSDISLARGAFDRIAGYIFKAEPAEFRERRVYEYAMILQFYQRTGGRYWLSRALEAIGGAELYRQVGNTENLRRVFRRLGFNRQEVSRVVKRVRESHQVVASSRFVNPDTTVSDLYGEMREAVLRKVA